MGNYLTIGAKFKPYSFEELIRPYQMYGQAYKGQEAGLEDLSNKSSIWEGLTNKDADRETHAAYEKYANDVQAQAESLSKNGLNATNRQQLLQLKQRYGKEIVPIEQAYAQRKQLLDEDKKLRQQAMMSGSALYSDRPDLQNVSLDEIIKNPNIAPQYETQAARISNAAKIAQTLAKQENGQSKWEKDPNGQWFERKTSTGLTQQELVDAANGKSTPRVEALINQAIETLGSSKWGNVDKNQLRNDVIQGLYAGMGETRTESRQNANFESDASKRNFNQQVEQFKWQKAKDEEQLNIAREKALNAGDKNNSGYLRSRSAIGETPEYKRIQELGTSINRRVKDPVTGKVYDPITAKRVLKGIDNNILTYERVLKNLKENYKIGWTGRAAYDQRFDKLSEPKTPLDSLYHTDYTKKWDTASAITKLYEKDKAEILQKIEKLKSDKKDMSERLKGVELSDKEYNEILSTTGATEKDDIYGVGKKYNQINRNQVYRTDIFDYNNDTDAGKKIKTDIEGSLHTNLTPYINVGDSGSGIYKIDENLNVDKNKPVKYNKFAGLLEQKDGKGTTTKASQIERISLDPQIMKHFDTPYVIFQTKDGDRYAVDANLVNTQMFNTLNNGWKQTVNSFDTGRLEDATALTNLIMGNSLQVFKNK